MTKRFVVSAALAAAAVIPVFATETEHTQFKLFRAPGPVTIDGKFDDWDLTGSMLICSDVENYRDQYASWQCAMYDDDNLYLLSRWIDPTPLNNPGIVGADMGFQGDCLQVRVIVDSTGEAKERESKTEKLCHIDAWRGRDGRDVVSAGCGRNFKQPGYKNMLELGAKQAFAVNADNSGYTQELSIPWKLLSPDEGYRPTMGDTLLMTYEPNFGTSSKLRISTKDLFRPNVTPDRVFAFRAFTSWGFVKLLGESDRTPMPVRLADGRTFPVKLNDEGVPEVDWNGLYVENEIEGFKPISFEMPEDGFVSLVIRDSNGYVVRNLLNAEFMTKGTHEIPWDGLTTTSGKTYGEPVAAGEYTWEAIWRKALDLKLVGWAANAGSSPFNSPGGNWGGDQGNPNAVDCDSKRVFLGWTGSEAGRAVVCVNYDGKVQWRHKRGGFGGASLLAVNGAVLFVYDAGQENAIYRLDSMKGEYVNFEGRDTAVLPLDPILEPYAPEVDGERAKVELSGMTAIGGKLFLSVGPSKARWHSEQPSADVVIALDAATGDKVGELRVKNPLDIKAGADGRLYLLADGVVSVVDPATLSMAKVVDGLGEEARSVAADADGNVYVGCGAPSKQIKVFGADGKQTRSIGREGGRALVGKWQKDGFHALAGMRIDGKGRLWVAECDDKPRRFTMWDAASGELLREFFGPTHYGAGGGAICPSDPYTMVGLNCEWKIDPETGRDECVAVISRGAWGSARFGESPDGRVYLAVGGGRAGKSVEIYERLDAGEWVLRTIIGRPTGEVANANTPPKGLRVWADRNGDQKEQPEEVQEKLIGDIAGWIDGWYMPMNQNLTFGGGNYIIAVTGWTECGAPEYDIEKLQRLPDSAVAASAYRGGMGAQRCIISQDGRYVIYNARYGVDNSDMPCFEIPSGRKVAAYPSNYVGVHGGHRAPPAVQGMIRAAYDYVGTITMPAPLGNIFFIGTDKGEWHIINDAGYYIGKLFEGDPMKIRWPDEAVPGANMNTVPPGMGAEDFGGSVIQADDGSIYVQAGKTAFIDMKLTGLETYRLLGGGEIAFTDEDVQTAQGFKVKYLSAVESSKICTVRQREVEFTGNPDKDFGEPAVKFGERDSLRGWIAYGADKLYLAWRADDKTAWVNGATGFENLYAMGDTVDFQLATDPTAERKRGEAGKGDLRLSIGNWRGVDTAVLYRKVSDEKSPMTFTSGVWRDGYKMDYVKIVSNAEITHSIYGKGSGYIVEAAIPLAALGLEPKAGLSLKGDFGFTFGDAAGTDTNLRIHWANKATGIVADEVAELMMQPALWGTIDFE